MTSPAVLAADIGGTSSKVLIATPEEVLGYAVGAGGNIRSNEHAFDNICAAIDEALAACPEVTIVAGHLGIAGAGPARHADINAVMQERWTLPASLQVSSDLDTAFMASAPSATGCLLLAGTGAVAARYDAGRMVRRCDGMGWILGDIGSGTWVGLEALRAVGAHLDHRGPATILTDLLQFDRRTGDPRQDLIAHVDTLQPTDFGGYASIVTENLDDPVCADIAQRATDGLLQSLAGLFDGDPSGDVVLAGGMLSGGRPLGQMVASSIQSTFPHVRIIAHQNPPILGALRLALGSRGMVPGDHMPETIASQTPFA